MSPFYVPQFFIKKERKKKVNSFVFCMVPFYVSSIKLKGLPVTFCFSPVRVYHRTVPRAVYNWVCTKQIIIIINKYYAM